MTTSRNSPKKAVIEHVLVFYDGPQLLLLRGENGRRLLAHAILKEGYKYPIACCQMLDRYYDLYMSGKVDLLFLFKATPLSRIYLADIDSADKWLRLTRISKADIGESFPEPGIFSTVHTHPVGYTAGYYDDKQRFLIDGVWEAKDISRFHGKVADTYTLLGIANELHSDGSGASQSDLIFLRDSIMEKPWQGGGSYLSFYGGIKEERRTSVRPLRVAGIEYHSPGYIDLAGRRDILDDLIRSIKDVLGNIDVLANHYRRIRKILSSEGMLKSDKNMKFISSGIEDYVKEQSLAFARSLGLPNSDLVLRACDGNVSVFAKLVLSYFRRVKVLADFYASGRVRTD